MCFLLCYPFVVNLKMLDRFVSAGGNFIDTADCYQNGESERILGTWLRRQPRRDSLIVATKLSQPMREEDPNCRGASRHHVMQGVEESLKRLQVGFYLRQSRQVLEL